MTEKLDTGPATLFNTHMSDVGNRLGTFCNYLILVDGGILSITIGAFLGATPPATSASVFSAIRAGWFFLTAGLIYALATTFVVLVAQINVQWQLRKNFSPEAKVVKLHTGPEWAAHLIRAMLWGAFLTSALGIATISFGAAQMLKPTVQQK